MASPTMTEQAQNVLSNAIAPIDIRKGKQVVGAAEYVALEVAVSKIVRTVLKMEHRGFLELAWIHAVSIPFMGGLGAPFGASKGLLETGENAGYTAAFKDGAKGIPAVLAAQWVIATAYKGFHFPWFPMKDLLITAGSKTITRPIAHAIIGNLPKDMADGLLVLDALVGRQVDASNLKSKES